MSDYSPRQSRKKKERVVFIAMIMVIGLALWFGSSLVIAPSRDDDETIDTIDSKAKLESILTVEQVNGEPHRRIIRINGETEASRMVALLAETSGKVVEIPVKEGQSVTKGTVIFKIDERDRRAQLKRAQASLKQRQIQYSAAKKLQEQGFQSEVRLAESFANLEFAKAELENIQQDLDFTRLKAPFDGVIEAIDVEVGDFVFAGAPGNIPSGAPVTIIDMDPMIVKGFISENDRALVSVGDIAKVEFSDGRVLEGTIAYLASASETASRSFRIEIELANADGRVASGVTATLLVPTEEMTAYKVSSSVLSLDDQGSVGVKHLNSQNEVVFSRIEIIEEVKGGVWVTGLPGQVRLITGGHAFVNKGQKIPNDLISEIETTPTIAATPMEPAVLPVMLESTSNAAE